MDKSFGSKHPAGALVFDFPLNSLVSSKPLRSLGGVRD